MAGPKRYLEACSPNCMEHLLALQNNPLIRRIADGMHALAGSNAIERMGFEPHPSAGATYYLEVEGDFHMLRLAWVPAPKQVGFDERKKERV